MKIYLTIVPVLALACGSSETKPTAVELAKFGLKMDAPAGTTVSDGIMGGLMVQGPNLVVTVDEATDARPKAAEDAAKEAEMYNPQEAKTEKLADGFAFTFVNTGDLGKNYWAQVRRDIGGKAYWCETTANSPEQQTAALAACKSLSKK